MTTARLESDCIRISHATRGLSLAATPTFAIMAFLTHGDASAVPCSPVQDASALHGMAFMYALMSLLHAAPWLKLLPRWRALVGRA